MSTTGRPVEQRSQVLLRGRVFDVVATQLTLPSGVRQDLWVVEHPGAVAISAIDERGELLLVRQYRHAARDLLLEIPAGRLEPGETPLEAARRELREETGLAGRFRPLAGALDGVPAGLLGYEEHVAGTKGLHMNFVFVTEVEDGAEVVPNDEFAAWRWVDRAELDGVASPLNVRQFGVPALDAHFG